MVKDEVALGRGPLEMLRKVPHLWRQSGPGSVKKMAHERRPLEVIGAL